MTKEKSILEEISFFSQRFLPSNKMSNYRQFKNFGFKDTDPANAPLARCTLNLLDAGFQAGGTSRTYGRDSRNCQLYMSQRCAANWDKFCELESNNPDVRYSDNVAGDGIDMRLNAGEILIRDTASEKYLTGMINGVRKMIPFDPVDAQSPKLTTWVSPNGLPMVPVYSVNPASVDSDPVLAKLLAKPSIAPDILVGLYRSAKKDGNLEGFNGTLLGEWFRVNANLLR